MMEVGMNLEPTSMLETYSVILRWCSADSPDASALSCILFSLSVRRLVSGGRSHAATTFELSSKNSSSSLAPIQGEPWKNERSYA